MYINDSADAILIPGIRRLIWYWNTQGKVGQYGQRVYS